MSRVTTDPAPIVTSLQMDTGIIVVLVPIITLSPIVTGCHPSGSKHGSPSRHQSFTKLTPWPTKQASPIVTLEQMNVCDCTRVFRPITTPRCTSQNGPTKQPSPNVHSYMFTGSTYTTSRPNTTSRMPTRSARGACAEEGGEDEASSLVIATRVRRSERARGSCS